VPKRLLTEKIVAQACDNALDGEPARGSLAVAFLRGGTDLGTKFARILDDRGPSASAAVLVFEAILGSSGQEKGRRPPWGRRGHEQCRGSFAVRFIVIPAKLSVYS
jgi:hypothetical protein